MSTPIYFYKAKNLSNLKADSIVAVKNDNESAFSLFITDKTGIPYPLKDLQNNVIITNTDGNLQITTSSTSTNINLATSILTTINSALQSGDNISELVNDVGYLTTFTETDPVFQASEASLFVSGDKANLDNQSGVNSGDQTSIVGISGTKAEFNTELTDGDFLFVGDVTQYTDELAQDAIGSILTDTSTIDFTYDDTTPSISAIVKPNSIDATHLAGNINISEFINDEGYITDVNLGYTPSPTNGIVTNDKGTDATIPTVDFTNAGLLTPEEKQLLYNNSSTGVTRFDGFSINVDTTKYNTGIIEGWFIDNTTNPNLPTKVFKSFPATTGSILTNLATQNVTYVAVDINGVHHQSGTPFEPESQRDWIPLGVIVHSNRIDINAVNNQPVVAISPNAQLSDLIESIGFFNISGNVFTPNGVNLNINKSAGQVFKQGANFINDSKDPHTLALTSLIAPTNLRYRTQIGTEFANTAVIDAGFYDLAGVRTAIPGTRWSIQRIYLFQSNLVRIQYGQATYTTQAEAIQAITTEAFVVEQNILENGLFRALLIVREGATDLTDTNRALFIEASKFGSVAGLGSLSTTNLQQAYNNSLTPEITTNSTLGAVSIKRGSTLDTDNVFEVQNGVGTVTSTIKGNGALTALSYNGYSPENAANKATDFTIVNNTLYPSTQAVSDATAYKRTIAQIRALTGTLPNNNFYTTDLGQQGTWYYDATDVISTDNTGTILVTADGKRIKRAYSGAVNLKWFGAIGDGIADNSSLFNTVLASFDQVYIPTGIYRIQSTISLSNKTITGDKPTYNGTTLVKGSIVDGGFTITGSKINVSRIGIINGLNSNGFTIRDNAQDVNVVECLLNVADHGILIQAFGGTCKNIRVFNCDAYGGIHGFVSKAENVTFENCRAFSPSIDGFAMVSDNFEVSTSLNNCINNNIINCEAYDTQIGVTIYSRDYYSTNNANNVVLRGLNIVGGTYTTMSAYGILVGDEAVTPGGRTYNDVLNISIANVNFDVITTAGIKYSRCNGVSTVGTNTTKNYAKDSNSKNVKHYATNITGSSLGNVVFNTLLTVNSTSPTVVNGETYYDTANTATTNIINFSGGKVGQVITVFIKDDFTTITDSGNMNVKNNIRGIGSFVTLKFRDNASGWDEINSYIVDKFQFFPFTATYTIDYALSENARTTLTGNVSSIVFSNMVKNSYFRLLLSWDGSTRTITGWDSRIIWLNGSAPASVSSSDRIVMEFYYDGTNIINTYRSDSLNLGLALKANIASPALTGTPTAPTAALGTNTTQIATTAFVQGSFVNLTGNQTITGRKTFISDNTTVGGINITNNRNITTGGTSDQAGFYIANNNTAQGLYVDNSSSGTGIQSNNTGTGVGLTINNFSTGTGLVLRTQSGGTGDLLNAEVGATRITSAGVLIANKFTSNGTIGLKDYTVATLPASPTQGDSCAVTDGLAPAYLGIIVGGGTIYTPVVYNGTNWVAH